MELKTLEDYYHYLTEQNKISEELSFSFLDFKVTVKSNSKELVDTLKEYYQIFINKPSSQPNKIFTVIESNTKLFDDLKYQIKTPAPGKTKIKEKYCTFKDGLIIRKTLTQMTFLTGDHTQIAVGECLKNPNQVINFINNKFIEFKLYPQGLLAHAAGICNHHLGIAIAGFSGMGKSTLALHLLNENFDFVSNDRLIVQKLNNTLKMTGVAKYPRINPGTILNNKSLKSLISDQESKQYSKLSLNDLWSLEKKYDATLKQCFPKSQFILENQLNCLFILNWKNDNKTTIIEKVSLFEKKHLLDAFMKDPGIFYDPLKRDDMTRFNTLKYLNALRGIDVYEVSGNRNFDSVTNFVLNSL